MRDALCAAGLDVWLDEDRLQPFQPIGGEIAASLAASKALLAFYSPAYTQSRACQWELTAAVVAAQRAHAGHGRVLVVNPQHDTAHVEPVELRDALQLAAPAPGDAAAHAALAQRVARHIGQLEGTLGGQGGEQPRWIGRPPLAAARFVGRMRDMWALHSALTAGRFGLITGAPGGDPAVKLTGMGGVGKSLLAQEYALRFGTAYPGGVFWLRAHGHDERGDGPSAARAAERDAQLLRFARILEIDTGRMAPEDLPLALERHLTARGEPFLWIVDDLPGGLEADALASWLAPGRLGHTLITTRSRGYDGVGAQLDLGAMDADDGFELLTRRRPPSGDEERRAARGLVDDLGRHALAIDVAGAALAAYAGVHTYAQYRAALTDPSRDELEIAAKLADELPGGHERSIAMTLARSISKLGQPGRDFLRLASRLATDPIPALLAVETIARVDRLDPRDARARAVAGMKEAGLHSLAEVIGVDEARQVHTLVSRTVRGLEKPAPRIDALAAATVTVLTRQLRASIEQRSDAEPPVLAHARHVSAPTRTQGQAALAIAVAWHDYRRGDFRGAAALELRALQTYRKLYGDRHPDTLTARDTLGETLRSLGDLAGARSHLDRAAAVLPGVLGSRHPRTLSAFNNLGLTLMQQGNLAKARTLLQRAVSGRLALLGETHPDTLASENNLAVVLGLQGDIPAARILHEHALLVRQELLGNYHPDTLVSLNNLAMMSREQGELDAAHALSVQALEGRRRILGDEHPETLVSLHNLAATLIAQGAHAQARDLLDQLVDARRRVLGPGHPDTHAAEHLLGAIS